MIGLADSVRAAARGVGRRPYLLLVVTGLIWAGNAIAGRLAVGEISPMALTCLRWVVVTVVLAIVARRGIVAEWPILRRHLPFLFVMGALGFTGFNALFYASAHATSAINIGVIQGVIPALVLLGNFAVFGVRAGGLQLAGLAATLAGVTVVAAEGDLALLRSLAFNVGDLGILLASALYAGYMLALRYRPQVSPLTAFAAMAVAAFLTSLPLLAWEVASGAVRWPGAAGWALVAFVGLGPSLVAQTMFIRGVELIGPARAGIVMNLVPIFAAILAVALLGETFAAYHAVALALVLGGIWLAERSA